MSTDIDIMVRARDMASSKLAAVRSSGDKLSTSLDRSSVASKKFGDAGSRALGSMTRAAKGLAVVGGAALVGLGAKGIDAASDLEESLSKVKVVFGDNAAAIESWSKGAARNLGLSQQAALEAAGTYGNLFDSMGIGSEQTKEMSTGLVNLSSDLASFNNLDPTVVLEKLRSGLVGETEPLRALGVNINQATLEAKAMELGLMRNNQELTAGAKAQASYALIMEQTTNAQGDFARTSGGLANQQRVLGAAFQDTLAQVGKALMPALTRFAGWLTENMPTIQKVLTNVVKGISTFVGWVAKAFSNTFSFFKGFGAAVFDFVIAPIGDVIEFFKRVVGAVAGFFDKAFIRPIQAAIGFIGKLIAAAEKAIDKILGVGEAKAIVESNDSALAKQYANMSKEEKANAHADPFISEAMREAGVPGFRVGGRITETGVALVHKGETINPARGVHAGASSGGGEQFARVVDWERGLIQLIQSGAAREVDASLRAAGVI